MASDRYPSMLLSGYAPKAPTGRIASVTQLVKCRWCLKMRRYPNDFIVQRRRAVPRVNKRLCRDCAILRREDKGE